MSSLPRMRFELDGIRLMVVQALYAHNQEIEQAVHTYFDELKANGLEALIRQELNTAVKTAIHDRAMALARLEVDRRATKPRSKKGKK